MNIINFLSNIKRKCFSLCDEYKDLSENIELTPSQITQLRSNVVELKKDIKELLENYHNNNTKL